MLASFLLAISLLVVGQADAGPQGGSRIRGVLIDAMGAALPNGFIRVFQASSNALVTRLRAKADGSFQTGPLQTGSFVLVAWVQGFRVRRLPVTILDGQTADLRRIQLDIGSYDAPGVMCDDFGLEPPHRVLSRGHIELKMGCAVDFRTNDISCPKVPATHQRGSFHLRVTREGVGTYFTGMAGTTLSTSNQGRESESRIRIDGMGPGDDVWVKTADGLESHVFFVDDVEPNSSSVRVWHVTRER